MSIKNLKDMLVEGAALLNVTLPPGAAEKFLQYKEELKTWNRKINLTSIESDEDVVIRHFLDSLTLCRFLRGTERLLDIGSGGGFPGLPLKLAMPGLAVTMLDSVRKKVFFMRHAIRTLGLTGIEAEAGRAQDPEVIAEYGQSFDCVTARALTGLKDFISLGFPFLKPEGVLLAMKGPAVESELKAVSGMEGVSPPEVHAVALPFSNRATTIVIVRRK